MTKLESIEKLRNWMPISVISDTAMKIGREYADAIQAEVDEKYMELPVDADGVPIHVGDVLEYDYGDDVRGTHMVCALIYDGTRSKEFDGGIWDFEFDDDDEGDSRSVNCMSDFYECEHHAKPRTVTDVLADLFDRKMSVTDAEHELRDLLGGDGE